MDMAKILIVDDDEAILRMLEKFLRQEGFDVATVANGTIALAKIKAYEPDIILLDINLPGEDGLTVAKKLRLENQNIGIIMVTGKGDIIDRVVGLEMGADDYIAKPFHLREVLARIRSILRRREHTAVYDDADQNGLLKKTLRFNDWQADLGARVLTGPDGNKVPLTSGDFRLLEVFLKNPQRVLSRDQILDFVAARQWEPYDRSVDTRVRRLRGKIEKDPSTPEIIKTVRGEGYVFSTQVEVSS
ncbi:DNA-binding response regulator [Paremcibacter congregatus]|uniref:Regulatory protein VirG n=2 Tax=Paremcibacter congregatus TaxID=2043170 RepID=A0A2G4YU35_9PROT|nr:DNA-binding response regulator [Paremcibacter congregatus]QDE26748.1 response regulator transcription factor [Paremcibacter congregatus]